MGFAAVIGVPAVHADVIEYRVTYEENGDELEAYVAKSDAVAGDRPGVLVCHAWWGQGGYTRNRARMLAELGYVAVVLDMYGKGVYTQDPEEARGYAGAFYNDRDRFRARARAGLEVLKAQPDVDPDRLAAIGYCFGGTTVLELAYAGADLAGVVSFHGSLMSPRPRKDHDDATEANDFRGEVLICHGQDDPFYANDKLLGVIDALQTAGVPTTTIFYSGAQHSFTDPTAKGELEGAQYQPRADRRSWQHMQVFFRTLFNPEDG
jgi:dienelactone hydrolase